MGSYKTAQVCRQGHTITTAYDENSERRARYCPECGSSTLAQCENCTASIRGRYDVEGVFVIGGNYAPPSYCHACGVQYPWTDARITAAKELADELEGLSESDRDKLKKTIDDLLKDAPSAEVGVIRYKTIMLKAGKEGATAMKNILVSVLTEATKRALFGP